MRRVDLLLRGRHRCVGLVLDPTTAGLQLSQHRVLEQWTTKSDLYELPDGRWLLRFGETVELASNGAPGLLVVEQGSGLTTAPMPSPESQALTTLVGGLEIVTPLAELDRIDPSAWIELDAPVGVLNMPVQRPEVVVAERPRAVEPDLRSVAKVGEQSARSAKFADEIIKQQAKSRRRGGATGVGGSGVAPRTHNKAGRGTFAKLALKTPAKGYVSRRHNQYLRDLESKFTRGELGEALRHAIPIGGLGGGALSLRVPGRRGDLRLSGGATGGSSVPYDVTVQAHLRKMYSAATEALEAEGRVDEAAFVFSELLNSAAGAVALLERHGRYRMAAELAEARELDTALVVRLWWLAGDKDRAMAIGRQGDAYAQLVKHLHGVDPEAEREFRLLWVDQLERSGNLHAAIAVGWVDPQIRAMLLNPIRRGIAVHDSWSLGLQAYLVALQPSEENRQAFISGLGDPHESDGARQFAAEVLAEVHATDPVADRQLCSAALRSLIELPSPTKGFGRSIDRIRDRADPLLAADLPGPERAPRPTGAVVIPLIPHGSREVNDVVPLSNGFVLVALGEAGIRLMNSSGRVAAEWSTPCHGLVASDHDKRALILTNRDSLVDVHVLDLVTRKTRHYGAIRSGQWAKSFDGGTWATVDVDGRLAFFDVLADSPTVIWRELDQGSVCHRLERSPESLAAVVAIPADRIFPQARTEMWRWELPRRRLDQRRPVSLVEDAPSLDLLADGHIIWGRTDGPAMVVDPSGHDIGEELIVGDVEVRVSQELIGYCRADGGVTVATTSPKAEPVATWSVGEKWGIRSNRNLCALWTSQGAIAVVDSSRRELMSVFATTA